MLNASDFINLDVAPPLMYDNGSFYILPGSYQAPLVSETNIKSLTVDGTAYSLLGSGTINVGSVSAGFSKTNVTSDPTSASPNGIYRNTTTGHYWDVDDDGISDMSAGTFTAWDMAPDAFEFIDKTGVSADGGLECSAITVLAGTNRSAAFTTSGDSGCGLSVNAAASTATGTVPPGADIQACVNRAATGGATTSCTPTIGGVTATSSFAVTTVTSSTVLDDNLVTASTAAITAHTPTTSGGTWSVIGAEAINTTSVGAKTVSIYSVWAWNDVAAFTNGTVTAKGRAVSTGPTKIVGAVMAGSDKSTRNGYSASFNGDGNLILARVASGSSTTLSTTTCSGFSVTSLYSVLLIKTGTALQASMKYGTDTICSVTATDSTYTTVQPGIHISQTVSYITDVTAVNND